MTRIVVFCCELILSGCWASLAYRISRGTTQQLQLASNPQGATASISSVVSQPSAWQSPEAGYRDAEARDQAADHLSCQTPCQLELPREASLVVTFTKTGCKEALVSVSSSASTGGTFLVGGASLGDAPAYDLQPNPVVANLDCFERSTIAGPAPPHPQAAPNTNVPNPAVSPAGM